MKPPLEQSPSRTWAVCCDLAADATVRVGLETLGRTASPSGSDAKRAFAGLIPQTRRRANRGRPGGGVHGDSRAGLHATSFRDWGVVAAPRFLGQPAMAAALKRFQAEGAWGVSPHLIPHRSLHSISGTVSQALKIHGPNFGVGGGPGGPADALLAAAAMLEGQHLPGVWLVLRLPWTPSRRRTKRDGRRPGGMCVGLALALRPIRTSHCTALACCVWDSSRGAIARHDGPDVGFLGVRSPSPGVLARWGSRSPVRMRVSSPG